MYCICTTLYFTLYNILVHVCVCTVCCLHQCTLDILRLAPVDDDFEIVEKYELVSWSVAYL